MPLAFTRVEESSTFLVEAAMILKNDPYSSVARKKLIDGARGMVYTCIYHFNGMTCPMDLQYTSFFIIVTLLCLL